MTEDSWEQALRRKTKSILRDNYTFARFFCSFEHLKEGNRARIVALFTQFLTCYCYV